MSDLPPPTLPAPAPSRPRLSAARIAAVYMVVATLWILLSDRLVIRTVEDHALIELLSSLKGLAFVGVTGTLIYGLLRLHEQQLRTEVAQRRKTEEALRVSDAQVRWLGDRLPGSYLFQAERRPDGSLGFLYVGAGCETIHQVTPAQVIADPECLLRQMVPEHRAAFLAAVGQSERELADFDFQLRTVRPDGLEQWLQVRSRPRRQTGGGVWWDGIATDLTTVKAAEAALRTLVNLLPDAVFINQDDRIVFANERAAGLWRAASTDQVLGRSPMDFVAPAHHALVRERIGRLLAGANAQPPAEMEMRALDGTLLPVETTASRTQFDGRPAIQVVVRDITDRKRAEAAVLQSEARFARAFSRNPAAIAVTRLEDGKVIEVNDTWVELTGYRREEMTGQSARRIWPEGPGLANFLAALRVGADSYHFEQEFIKKSGERFVAEVVAQTMDFHGEQVILSTLIDITGRKQATAARDRQERRMTLLADISRRLVISDTPSALLPEIFTDLARELEVDVFANYMVVPPGDRLHLDSAVGLTPAQRRAVSELRFGESLCGLVARDRRRLVFADLPASNLPQAEGIIALGVRAYAGHPLLAGEQLLGTISFGSRRKEAFDEDDVKLMKTVVDQVSAATERSRLLGALRESEIRFREVVENIEEVFWLFDVAQRRLTYVSPSFAAIWGQSAAVVCTSPEAWERTLHPEDRGRVMRAIAERQHTGQYHETYRVLRPDGSVRWVRDRAFPVRHPDGSVARFVGITEDITRSRELESRFLRSQRLEAVGTLAGGIAHDLNNILAPVLMISGLLKDRVTEADDVKMLGMLEASAKRGAAIIRQLLAFSRGAGGERSAVEVRHLAKEMVALMKETFPREIALTDDFPPQLWSVQGDATQLHQVLLNLCVNARDAMPTGGALHLTGENVELSARDAERFPDARPGRYLRVTVRDTGQGMPTEIIDRIFDPFFTTKEIGKGTGLGLSTVSGIVKSHGGFVTVESTPGRGSTFAVHLPAAQAGAAGLLSTPLPPLARGRGETILVVDDEASVLTSTRMVLEDQGYRVVAAADGREAMAVFLANQDAVRLVVTDLMMPVMGGPALVRALKSLRPQLPVIATTGLEQEAQQAELLELGVASVLRKPCLPSELLALVRQHLDPAGG